MGRDELKAIDVTVFLDRDGTINEDAGYINDPDKIVLLPGAIEAIKRLNNADVRVVIVTNQSGIGRGYYTEEDMRAVNDRVSELLAGGGASFDALYYCPHDPDDKCACRKPETGMIEQALSDHSIDTKRAYLVGDKVADVEAALRIGIKGILVLTGHGEKERERLKHDPDFIAPGILEAIEWIEKDSGEMSE